MTYPVDLEAAAYVRFLAKVALGMAVFEYGLDGLADVFVRKLILGDADGALTWVGELHDKRIIGDHLPCAAMNATLVRTIGDVVVVYVQLFRLRPAWGPVPIYQVVVGRRGGGEPDAHRRR